MTSDFQTRPEPKSYGTSGTGTPTEITIGGSAGPSSGSNADTAAAGDADRLRSTLGREASSIRTEAADAAGAVKDTAASLASTAKAKAAEGVEAGKAGVTSSLGDFAAAVRKASDELGERDQSMAAGLVREVATGLEQAAGAIKGQSLQDITRSVAGFARRQPATFLIGAALAGIALGRFARASGDHGPQGSGSSGAGSSGPSPDRWNDDDRSRSRAFGGERETVSGRSHPVTPPVSPGTSAPPRTAGFSDTPVSYGSTGALGTGISGTGPSAASQTSYGTSGSAFRPAGGSLSEGAATGGSSSTPGVSSSGSGLAPAEGPSEASLGRGSGSFNPQGDRDVR